MSLPPRGGSTESAPAPAEPFESEQDSGPEPAAASAPPRGGRRGGRREGGRRSARKRRRGTTALAAVGLTVLVVAVVAVVAIIIVSDDGDIADEAAPPTGEPVGQHGSLPECDTAEGAVLDDLVPNAERTLDDSTSEEGWELHDCQWSSASLRYGQTAGFAAVMFIRNSDDPLVGVSGSDVAGEDLQADVDTFSGSPLDGLGDEAATWYNAEDEVGCVGAVTANMYTVTCHDAQGDGGAWGSLDEDAAIDGARELAEYVVPRVEVGDY